MWRFGPDDSELKPGSGESGSGGGMPERGYFRSRISSISGALGIGGSSGGGGGAAGTLTKTRLFTPPTTLQPPGRESGIHHHPFFRRSSNRGSQDGPESIGMDHLRLNGSRNGSPPTRLSFGELQYGLHAIELTRGAYLWCASCFYTFDSLNWNTLQSVLYK